jgi:hypothetical protein
MLNYRPDRSAKIYCVFGLSAILCASLLLFLFSHLPAPWGIGTLPGGLTRADDFTSIQTMESRQVDVLVSLIAVGLAGIILLLGGCGLYVVSKLKNRAASK